MYNNSINYNMDSLKFIKVEDVEKYHCGYVIKIIEFNKQKEYKIDINDSPLCCERTFRKMFGDKNRFLEGEVSHVEINHNKKNLPNDVRAKFDEELKNHDAGDYIVLSFDYVHDYYGLQSIYFCVGNDHNGYYAKRAVIKVDDNVEYKTWI